MYVGKKIVSLSPSRCFSGYGGQFTLENGVVIFNFIKCFRIVKLVLKRSEFTRCMKNILNDLYSPPLISENQLVQ